MPGTAVFLTSDPEFAPASLMHNLKHNKVLHEQQHHSDHRGRRHAARTDDDERVQITPISERFTPRGAAFRLRGVAERAEGARDRAQEGPAIRHHVDVVLPVAALAEGVGAIRHAGLAGPAVIGLARSANDATDFFQIPTGRVVEVGTQVAV